MLVLLTKLSIMRFPASLSDLHFHFSVPDGFGWSWKLSLRRTALLMLVFLKYPFFVLLFSWGIFSKAFLVMLYAIWVPMLMILLSVVSVIRLLICDICSSWLLNLNLICETVRSGLGNGLIWGRLSLTLGKLILGNTTELIWSFEWFWCYCFRWMHWCKSVCNWWKLIFSDVELSLI